MRIYVDLRKPPWTDRNAFSCRRLQSCRAASADEKTVLCGGTSPVVSHRRGIRRQNQGNPRLSSTVAGEGGKNTVRLATRVFRSARRTFLRIRDGRFQFLAGGAARTSASFCEKHRAKFSFA